MDKTCEVTCKCDPCKCDPCNCGSQKKCPCPPECQDKMKKLHRYLKDSKVFLKYAEKCPLAFKLIGMADELLDDFKCSGCPALK